MTDILIPRFPSVSYGDWVGFELVLPHGYKMVATVERPDGTHYDLGQNNEGKYRLFKRCTGELENSHDQRGEPLSDVDLQGFGLTRDECPLLPGDLEAEGDFSSVFLPNLIRG